MKKLGLLFVTISMTIIISGCGDIVDEKETYSSSTDSLKTNSTSSSSTRDISADSAESILSGNTYYVSRADNGYTKHVFGETLKETSYAEDGEVIETNTFSIRYSGTTVKIEGDIYEVTKQTHSITIVGDGKTRVFWDAIEYAKGIDAESILSGKTFYYIGSDDEDDDYSYHTEVFTGNTLVETSYTEDGEVIEINTMNVSYPNTSLTRVNISKYSYNLYEVIREVQSVSLTSLSSGKTYIFWDTLEYARANYDN